MVTITVPRATGKILCFLYELASNPGTTKPIISVVPDLSTKLAK